MSLQGNATARYTLRGQITSIPKIDDTLTKEGWSADAKATGDAIREARKDLDEIDDNVALAKKYADDAAKAAELAAKAEASSITPADIGAATEEAVQAAQNTADIAVVNAAAAQSAADNANTALAEEIARATEAEQANATAAANAQTTANAALPSASAANFLRIVSFDSATGTLTTAQGVG